MNLRGWDATTAELKEYAVRIANHKAFSFGPIHFDGIPGYRYPRSSEEARGLRRKNERMNARQTELYEQFHLLLTEIIRWRNGAPLPPDLRRCKNDRCTRIKDRHDNQKECWHRNFFLVRNHRSWQKFCSRKCKQNYHARNRMNFKKRASKARILVELQAAMEEVGMSPGWKPVVALKAGVTLNFVTRAINEGRVRVPERSPL